MTARFARTIRNLLVPPPVVPRFDEHVDPEIARIECAIARLPKRTREVFLMHRLKNRSEEHTSELQSLMRISYAVFCLKKKNKTYEHKNQAEASVHFR